MVGSNFAHTFSSESLRLADNFRLLMDAMAHPGKILSVPDVQAGIGNLNAGGVMAMLTLCDHETPVWLDNDLNNETVLEYIRFYCGSPLTQNKSKAFFALFSRCPDAAALEGFAYGIPAYPDRSTALIIQVKSIEEDGPLSLSGPGIKTTRRLCVAPISSEFWQWRHGKVLKFPLGVDVFFVTDHSLVALPRTTKVMEIA